MPSFDTSSIDLRIAQFQFKHSARERYRIYRKLEGMLRMNESLSRCLDRLYLNVTEMGKYPNRPAAQALKEWYKRDRGGELLSVAMMGWIPDSELFMIRAGEESGALVKAFSAIQLMGERARQMRAAVLYAVTYPLFMMLLVSAVLWMFGVNLIQNMRATAPPQVLASMSDVAAVSDFIRDWGFWTLGGIAALLMFITATLPVWRGPIRARFDLYPPWSWYRVLQGSAFMLGLSSLLGAQVPIKKSLEILEEHTTPWLRERIYSARQEVLRGKNIGEALRAGGYNFPDPTVAIDLEILAERGDISAVLEDITQEWIRDQIEFLQRQAGVSRNLGMVAVGGTIGWAMSSVFKVVEVVSKGGFGNNM